MALFPMMSGLAWPNVVNPPHFGLGQRRRRRETEDSYGDVIAPEVPMVGANGLLGQFDPNAQYPAVEPEEQMDPRYSIQAQNEFQTGQGMAAPQQAQGGLMSRLGGLFGGGPQNINLALLQAGLGTMAAGGWHKMPVTLGQAIGQGSYPSVQTQIEQNKWDEQRGMREEELNIRRLSGQAYADQVKAQAEERKQKMEMHKQRGDLFEEYQAKVAAGDQAGAIAALERMVALDKPEDLAKLKLGQRKAPPTVVVGAGGKMRQRMAFNPETGEFDTPVGQPYESGALVTNNVSANAYDKTEGGNIADQMDAIQKAGFAATGDIQRYDRLGSLLGQVSTGKFKGTTLELKAAAKGLGFDLSSFGIADDVAPAQAARALSRALALELRNPAGGAGMPGALSDSDRQFLESMVPGVESDPGAWPQMIEAYKQLKRREMQVAKLAREYAKRNGGNLDYGFLDELETYSAQNPLFKNVEQKPQPIKDKYRLE
jgi:hypothetical protein